MNAAIFCGLVFGVGVAGLVRGIRPSRPLLKLSGVDAAAMRSGQGTRLGRLSNLVGLSAATWAADVGLLRGGFWDRMTTAMAVADVSVDQLALQTVQAAGTAGVVARRGVGVVAGRWHRSASVDSPRGDPPPRPRGGLRSRSVVLQRDATKPSASGPNCGGFVR